MAAVLSKQKTLDADPRAIQQIVFTDEVKTKSVVYYILQKKQVLEFYKEQQKF